jgi:uncharacterized protein YggE
VSGQGEAAAPADLLVAHVSIGADAEHIADAIREVGETAARIATWLRKRGLEPRDVTTTDIGTSARYDDAGHHVVGYRARHAVQVRCRDLSGAGLLLADLTEKGGDAVTIDHVTLDIADRTPLELIARERAFKDAARRAAHYASLAARDLGQVEEVSDSPMVQPGPRPFAAERFVAQTAAMPVEAGELTTTVQVKVRWSWQRRRETHRSRASPLSG